MDKSVGYISISHRTASIAQREVYHISAEEKLTLADLVRQTFPDIAGLFILSTCNRTEIYFESATTNGKELRNFFIAHKAKQGNESQKRLFNHSHTTKDTVRHLLEVSSGLASSVLGDAEIVHQIKKAYQFSIAHNLQGSLLERAMQSVFKGHKRISNETHFRDGTTSIAYKSLKVIGEIFGKEVSKSKKILLIGTGDIVMQLLKYNSKFNFNRIYIANRTEERANKISTEYHCRTYGWHNVVNNDFEDFDVIISAVSNCHHLIKTIKSTSQKLVLIDLALPGNINNNLARESHILFHDLDTISNEMEDTKEKRNAAISQVDTIIDEELSSFMDWYQGAVLRAFLAEYKSRVNQKVLRYFEARREDFNQQMILTITNRIIRKSIKQNEEAIEFEDMDAVISEQASYL